MGFKRVSWVALAALSLAYNVGCSSSESGTGGTAGDGGAGGGGGAEPAPYAANVCVAAKQAAAGAYCRAVADAWAAWAADQDDGARDAAIDTASTALGDSWESAETAAADAEANCSDRAWPADDAATEIAGGVAALSMAVNDGLDLGTSDHATCSASALAAVGEA